MSKAQRQIKHTNIRNSNAMGQHVEHTETVDDNPLPDAEEIMKLHAIDPDILTWLKARAEKEQEFRHDVHMERLDIVYENEKNNRRLNTTGLWFAFIIFLSGMGFSAFLIEKGHNITGTIFCAGTLLAAAGLFITRKVAGKQATNTSVQQ